jgi:hypothetical protein
MARKPLGMTKCWSKLPQIHLTSSLHCTKSQLCRANQQKHPKSVSNGWKISLKHQFTAIGKIPSPRNSNACTQSSVKRQAKEVTKVKTYLNESDSNIVAELSAVSKHIKSKGWTSSTAAVFELETCNHCLETTYSTRWEGQCCHNRLISATKYFKYSI